MGHLEVFDLTSKRAIVTGGGRGLGRAMALALAEAGADVAVISRTLSELEQVAQEIRQKGRKALSVVCDVSVLKDVQQMVEKVIDEFGGIDILVNDAGIVKASPAEDMSEQDWRDVIEVDLTGTFFCCQAVGRHMIKQKSGKIINLCSMTGTIVNKDIGPFCAYCAAKAGAVHLTKALAVEWAKYNIHVNSISPGYFETPMSKPYMAIPEVLNTQTETTPMKRIAQPEELAGAVVFLASDASTFVTGHDLLVDGGHTVW